VLDIDSFRVNPGETAAITSRDSHSKRGFEGGKREGRSALPSLTSRLADLQTRLWAESKQKLLVVLQAMDTGGKDGTIRRVFSGVNPQGLRIWSFGRPTEPELAHDFLWRVHLRTPENGVITIFNRSHYEDVLIARVRNLVPEPRWEKRFGHIVDFEKLLCDEGTTIVKLFLHISREEQRERLQARLDDPSKHWKFSVEDLDDRRLWDDYVAAYEDAVTRTSTANAPWYVVPADRKWYRDLVVSSILVETLERMDPRFPPDPNLEGVVID
jgi:PPK2 family polyphosphate:nucleotide phosphotransferase